ncbi:MAG: hypothetical protein LBE18_04625, partial [Planctomycetaceae bacterium]|nr:hypothetical protein [Planctomycetaceae bacterium]
AIELVWEQTQGQPWLVNAIAREVIVKKLQKDYTRSVTIELVEEAIQTIIQNRPTHVDNLMERLNEERVRKIIEPLILGEDADFAEMEDFLYTRDLGLIRKEGSTIIPANPIYAEIIIRKLSSSSQQRLMNDKYPYQIPRYLKNGQIDMDFLMQDFQQFWRENSAIWVKRFDYKEAAAHLVLMAFLQRIINGGGTITREMALGTERLDLCLEYNHQKYPIELKIRYGKKYVAKGLEKTADYIDACGAKEGWLVVFNRSKNVKWEDKIFIKKEVVDGKTITVVGL